LILGTEQTAVSSISVDNQELVHWSYLEGSIVDIKVALEECDACGRVLEEWGNGPPFLLIDIRNLGSITREARRHFASQELSDQYQTRAVALVIGSPVGSVIGNFWQSINRPPHPTRLFTHPEKAADWLLSVKAESLRTVQESVGSPSDGED
jgi:hypothetical protein